MTEPAVNVNKRRKIGVRLAMNEDGNVIKGLLDTFILESQLDDVDWTDIYPYWLIAESDGYPVGCIQVCPGKPIGRLEMLAVDQSLPHPVTAKIVQALLLQGLATLRKMGSQLASGMIPFEMKQYKKILRKRGAVVIFAGNALIKRL